MEEDLVAQLNGALLRMLQVHRCLPMGGLPMGEFYMLQLIRRRHEEQPDAKGVYISALTQCTHASQPAVSRTLRRLESKGLAERRTDPRDRRTTYVVLTEEGRSLLEACQQQMETLALRVIERVGAEELRSLTAQLNRLAETVQEEQSKLTAE